MPQSEQVCVGEIHYVDVVANAGAVGSRIIVAEERYWFASGNRAQQQRYQVRFGIVLFAEARFGIGAAGVEVAQADAAQVAELIHPCQDLLHHYLRIAVRAERSVGRRFGYRNRLRHPVHRRR